ncbi:MAG: Dyp-type peroxidase [Actinoplanes sp.]
MAAGPLVDAQQIQGNIIRPFRGQHQAFLFVSFRQNRAGARAWLGAVADRVAGTEDVPQGRKLNGGHGPSVLMNVGITASGLVLLHPETAADLAQYEAFREGPLGLRLDDTGHFTTTAALLGDVDASDPRKWVIGGPGGPPVDALLTLAADDQRALDKAVLRETREAGNAGLKILPVTGGGRSGEQRGEIIRNEKDRPVEHFGFADGISQPAIKGFHDPERVRAGSPVIAAGEFLLGFVGERRPQSARPRTTPAPWMHGGSFQVFRRLRQDVSGWWERMAELGKPEEEAARALGRHLDGRPLAPDADRDKPNEFDYAADPDGAHTPLHAHIRKVNPRDDNVFRDRSRKMLRRGIPFGPRFDRRKPDDRERGLIFNAYVADIEVQYEFVQRRWANNPMFPGDTLKQYDRISADRVDGLDPILGDDAQAAGRRLQPEVFQQIKKDAFGGFVTTTGAVYAFAPSLPALRLLAGAETLESGLVAAR